jgi:hypothetical protein
MPTLVVDNGFSTCFQGSVRNRPFGELSTKRVILAAAGWRVREGAAQAPRKVGKAAGVFVRSLFHHRNSNLCLTGLPSEDEDKESRSKWMRWALAALAVTVVACGNPTTPTTLSTAERSDFSVVWRGEYQVTTCNGARNCFAYRGTQRTFSLRLSQTGTNVFGVLTVGGIVNIGGGVSVDVTGTVNPSGLLTLTGSRTAATAFDPNGDIQVTRFVVQRDMQRGLTGSLEYVVRYTPQQNPETGSVSWAGDLTTAISRMHIAPV